VQGSGNRYLDDPPDVTTGRVVVVVGGRVVVVVGGLVVGVVVVGVVAAGGLAAGVEAAGVVVVVDVVGEGGVAEGGVVVVPAPEVPGCAVVGTAEGDGAFEPADEPGCSLATVTPMKALAPPATTIVVLVNRLMRASARARALGEYRSRVRLIAGRRGRCCVRRWSVTWSTVAQ
jgi:hypothetical protein